MPMSSQVAIVSSSVDSEFARQLIADLRDVGLEVTEAPQALAEPGPGAAPLPAVRVFLVVLSAEGLRSAWLLRALGEVRTLLGAAAARRMIAVRLGEVALPAELAGHVTADFFGRPREQAILSLEFAINTALYELDASGSGAGEPYSPEKVKELEERYGTLGETRAAGAPPPIPAPQGPQEDLPVETERVGGMAPPSAQPGTTGAPDTGAPPMPEAADERERAITLDHPAPREEEAPSAPPAWQLPPSPPRPSPPPAPWQPVPPGSASDSLQPAGLPPDLGGVPAAAPPFPPQSVPPASPSQPAAQQPGSSRYGDTGPYGDLGQSRFLRTDPEAVAIRSTEQVTFTVYQPREVEARAWQQMLVYLALDTPRTLAGVAADADERLGNRKSDYRAAPAPTSAAIKRGTRLAIVPSVDGFTFNPPALRVTWEEDVQRHEFRLRATSAPQGRAANGSVQIYRGMLLLAEVPISIYVRQAGERADIPSTFASIVARAYRRIFASYSHGDTLVVRSCESAAEALGDRYLRDVTMLRSGQEWDERLLRAVGDADIFQLFWSEKAAHSLAVEKEWRHALALSRRGFIRPVYWSRKPYAVPPELADIHFDRLDLARLGLTGMRMLTVRLLGRG